MRERAANEDVSAAPDPAMRSVWRAVLSGLSAAALVVILAIGVLAIGVPAATGSTALTVLTSSMEPGLPPGTMVVVRPTPPDEIRPGAVMTYQLRSGEPTLVTHRVTQRLQAADGEQLFITQGDANRQPDADPVRAVQVRGTVWYAIPYLGWVATGVTGEHRAIIVTVAVVGLFGYAAWAFGSAFAERLRRPADDGPGEPSAGGVASADAERQNRYLTPVVGRTHENAEEARMGNEKENFFEKAKDKVEDVVDDVTDNDEGVGEETIAPLGGLPEHN